MKKPYVFMFMQAPFFRWAAVAVWLGVIYCFSAQPDLHSGLDGPLDFFLRKSAHIAEYYVLMYLFINALRPEIKKINYLFWLAAVLTLTAAGFDEYHQAFVGGRVGIWTDVVIDSVGIVLYGGLLQFYGKNLPHQ